MTGEEKILDILAEMSLHMATKDDIAKINIRMETDMIPKQEALAEGIAAILEQLVPISRVDELENRVKLPEAVLSNVTNELQQLKQAQ